MRLQRIETGHRLPHRLFLALVRRKTRMEPPDVMKLLCYRPEFFGYRLARLTQAVLRGRSEWSVGERELFASFTSRLNQCHF